MILDTLQSQVEDILNRIPETRNSDKKLTWAVWRYFYSIGMQITEEQFMDLPSQDSVKRIRAKLQNDDHRYLPTNLEIALKRGFKEEEWREWLGYRNDLFDN
jgi:hypothetical protein